MSSPTTPSDERPHRELLVEAAARLLATSGPETLSTRKVAREAGISSMGVYTHFGSMSNLIAAVVEEGFQRLATTVAATECTGDPVPDLLALSYAHLDFARANPNLYRVMFGGASLGEFGPLRPEQMHRGRVGTLDQVASVIKAGIAGGGFAEGSAWHYANRWFAAMHGYIMLELTGYVRDTDGPAKVLEPLLASVFQGFAVPVVEAATS